MTDLTATLAALRSSHFRFPLSGASASGFSERQIEFMNRVFCRVETYSTNIEAMPASGRNAANARLTALLRASQVYNRGPDNLEEVLDYMRLNGGAMPYEDLSEYTGDREKFFPHTVDAPDSFVFFARALDEELQTARQRLVDYQSSMAALQELVILNDTSPDAWQRTKTLLDAVNTARAQVDRYNWMLAGPVAQLAQASTTAEFSQALQRAVDSPVLGSVLRAYDLISVLDAAGRLRTRIDAAAGQLPVASSRAVAEFGNLLSMLQVTCNFLPVLGSFYTSIFDGIPGMVAIVRSSYTRSARGLQRTLGTGPSPSPCSFCGGMVLAPCSARTA